MQVGVDKVVFTGSARVGREILGQISGRLTPAIMELSGWDACLVRQDADLSIAAQAVAFGLSLNRGRTCIAPRRILVHRSVSSEFEGLLSQAIGAYPRIPMGEYSALELIREIQHALASGAHLISGSLRSPADFTGPLVLGGVFSNSRLLREDFFAPVAVLQIVDNDQEALALAANCPYALGTTIFSRDVAAAHGLARFARAGVVVINDMIVPTADPRLPFGGSGESGFGVTRGPEGLLEMTRPKVIVHRRTGMRPYFAPAGPEDASLFAAYAAAVHGSAWRDRLAAGWRLLNSILKRRDNV
jgi:acyl-CoA reductase-like NAD-dependent aldehyde dehydrogenase